jgi:hypothetical protein
LPPPASISLGQEVLRRLVVALVLGLIVAWPIVPGEDPGLLSDLVDSGAVLALPLLAFVGGLLWSVWRLWTGRSDLRGGLVEVGFLLFAFLTFVSISAAGYKRPAWLTAWQWLGLTVLFFLVRQLADSFEEQTGFFAVLLASVVALSAQGVYQAAVELPRGARIFQGADEKAINEAFFFSGSPTEEEREITRQKYEGRMVSATFFRPAALAGLLVLLVPGLLGAGIACYRGGAPAWQTIGVFLCILLVLVILCLTRQPLALVALGFMGVLVLAVLGRSAPLRVWGQWALALLAATAIGWGLFRVGFLGNDSGIGRWQELGGVTRQVIREHPWWGVGAGNFELILPHYLFLDPASLHISQPQDFLLEIAASYGLPALVVLLATLGWFFWKATRPVVPPPAAATEPAPPPAGDLPLRWELYLGGTLGMLLGFVLRAGNVPGPDILGEAIAAVIRVVVWFGAVALFERIPWSEGEFRFGVLAGVGGLFVFLLGSGGIGWPSLTGLLMVMLALALASRGEGALPWWQKGEASLPALRFLPLPVFLALVLGYFTFAVYPVTSSAGSIKDSLRAANTFLVDAGKNRKDRTIEDPAQFAKKRILEPLKQAARDEPDNVRVQLYLAEWYGKIWSQDPVDPKSSRVALDALAFARKARELNPHGVEGLIAEHGLRTRFRTWFQAAAQNLVKEAEDRKSKLAPALRTRQREIVARLRSQAREQQELGIEVLRQLCQQDPTSARFPYLLARELFDLEQHLNELAPQLDAEAGRRSGEEADRARELAEQARRQARQARTEALEQAEAAQRLDERIPEQILLRRLTETQREQLEKWLPPAPAG